ncbi:hypothetical protein BLOT_008606 [Blomia tropicalis]|nr:hypothetical protein BLOT_008606 [Blomia tropicalis]
MNQLLNQECNCQIESCSTLTGTKRKLNKSKTRKSMKRKKLFHSPKSSYNQNNSMELPSALVQPKWNDQTRFLFQLTEQSVKCQTQEELPSQLYRNSFDQLEAMQAAFQALMILDHHDGCDCSCCHHHTE